MALRSFKPLAERLVALTLHDPATGCSLWQGSLNNKGYGQAWTGSKVGLAHRASFEVANGPIPTGMKVLHRCDNPQCVNPEHLFLGTQADNVRDMLEKGRAGFTPHLGEDNGSVKLTEQSVRQIYSASGSFTALGKQYGISRVQVSNIKNHRAWQHLNLRS